MARAALFGEYVDLTAQDALDEGDIPARVRKASCGKLPTQSEFDQSPVNWTIVIAAGAQAEKLLFDSESDGFVGDRQALKRLYFGLPKADRSHLRHALEQAEIEIASGYVLTFSLLQDHELPLRAIANAALANLESAGMVSRQFEERTVLAAEEVRQLFQLHRPSRPCATGTEEG